MNICVIICTYNRGSVFHETLASFLAVARPTGVGVELLIVDNNSSDDTPEIAQKFCRLDSQLFRYIRETQQGLSFARNAGIRASRADLIAFVDDDVYFDPQWLVEMVKLFQDHPQAMCAGGRSEPLFETGKPEWITPNLLSFYGVTNSGPAVKSMRFPEHPFGLNMAFRSTVFDLIGGFNTTLGRDKSSLLSNEETELFHRIEQAGLPVYYTPYAVLQHRIPESRTRKRWVLRRQYWQGVSDLALRRVIEPVGRRELSREARRFGALWGIHALCFLGALLTFANERLRFTRRTQIAYDAGRFVYAVRVLFQAKPPTSSVRSTAPLSKTLPDRCANGTQN